MKFEVCVPTWEIYIVEAPETATNQEIIDKVEGEPDRYEQDESGDIHIWDINGKER